VKKEKSEGRRVTGEEKKVKEEFGSA